MTEQKDIITKRYRRAQRAPHEYREAMSFFDWVRWKERMIPELALLFHVPNGEARDAKTGAKLKAMGVRPGIPDYLWPHARGNYHGLALELKRQRGSKTTDDQLITLALFEDAGWRCEIAAGAQAAIDAVQGYLRLPARQAATVSGER